MHCANASALLPLLVAAALVPELGLEEPQAASGTVAPARMTSVSFVDDMTQWYDTTGYTMGTSFVTGS